MNPTNQPGQTANLDRIREGVANCQSALEKLQRTCCMAERSARMVTLGAEVAQLGEITTRKQSPTPDDIEADILQVGNVGSAIGALFATCCTPTREKLYLMMFKSLGEIHTGLWRLKGVSH